MMINSERNAYGMVGGGTATPALDKQLPASVKKTALRDVQNENAGSIHYQQWNLITAGGKSCGDTVKKVCGNKRLTPDRPSSSQAPPCSPYNATNENVMNARRRFELELGMGKLQNNVEKKNMDGDTVVTTNSLKTIMAFSSGGPSVPNSLGKHSHCTPITKVSQELPRANDFKNTTDLLRAETERFIRLQKFLKQHDEAIQRDYSQRLMPLSPLELSKYAVELEKRAIQLTIDEGNEMQRMKVLNIFTKPSPEAK